MVVLLDEVHGDVKFLAQVPRPDTSRSVGIEGSPGFVVHLVAVGAAACGAGRQRDKTSRGDLRLFWRIRWYLIPRPSSTHVHLGWRWDGRELSARCSPGCRWGYGVLGWQQS